MNRRIAISAMSILASLAMLGGATFAFFSDSATSSGNIFSAGTLDLHLDDNDEPFSDSVSLSLNATNLAPGGSFTDFISLHNGGTIPAAEVEFGADQTSNSNGGDGSDLADVLDLTVMTGPDRVCTGGADHTPAIAGAIGNGSLPLTLTELVSTDYDALPGLAADNPGTTDEYFLCLTATMQSGAGNQYQGDSKTVNFVFTANQNTSQ